ncbi:hypothetical protein SAMN06273572_103189 [Monaibacterium marinum]|uniref:DUF2239 domain-containing protein n=1 Tax=Pontivivens marinum TaxID=1690039 RepID=A0A2C9CRI6_9RHOB|nr:DUF2239 family protein [Monaibacterium marinum]SOH94161.1 hypothetical protein SAMN06273572_103189 [Monaibacterium marinum]
MTQTTTFTAFRDGRIVASGALPDVAVAVSEMQAPALIFCDVTGQVVDLDLRGTQDEIRTRHAAAPRAPGRPKLGVTAKEVTLLPRHWDWLAQQKGGASATLRRLVEEARRADTDPQPARIDAAYRVMSHLAGDLPRFEEASRALYAHDRPTMIAAMQDWPPAIADHVEWMLDLRPN